MAMPSSCINLFALHYFLWYAGISSIYGYVSTYAQYYANASASEYGLLNMILPFVTIGSKLVFCSLADRHRAYRTFFVIFLITALIGYGSFAVLPFLIEHQPRTAGLNRVAFALICLMTSTGTIAMSVISCLSDAFAVNSAKRYGTSYGRIRLWGTIGWGASALLLAFMNQTDALPPFVPGLLMTIALITVDIVAVLIWPKRDDFKLDKSGSGVGVEDVVTVLALDSRQTLEDKERCLVGQAQDRRGSGYGTAETKPPKHNIGSSGGGSGSGSGSGSQNNNTREISFNPERAVDISSVKMQWILFKQVAGRRRSIFRYMILFTISGALISLQWSYFFLYLVKIYTADFYYISGLSMVGQSMLGELPFFLLSQYIIKLLGRSNTLSVSIASIGFRYLLYEYLLPNESMYFVLLTETFQGPNFGLFYVVMTEVGLDYSDCEEAIVNTVERGIVLDDPDQIEQLRQALRATMQSLMSACYEGLGVGIGSIVGGLVIDNYGYSNLWFYAALTALVLGLANLIIDLSDLPILKDKRPTVVLKT